MKRISMILTLVLITPACDDPRQDGEDEIVHNSGEMKVSGNLAADLKQCADDGAEQGAVDCFRDVLDSVEETTALLNDPLDFTSAEIVSMMEPNHSCSSRDGSVDCYCSGGCKRSASDCWCV